MGTGDKVIPTPRTDAVLENARDVDDLIVHARDLERELHWARVRIEELTAEAKCMLSGYNACNEDWRKAEEQLELAERKLTYLRSQLAGEMGEKLYKLEQELAERDEQLMRWFKAASPYATPGSLRAALDRLENAAPQELPAVNSARRDERTTLQPGGKHPEGPLAMRDSAKQPADAAPIDSTIKPSAWD